MTTFRPLASRQQNDRSRVAVIDLGSNTASMAVFENHDGKAYEISKRKVPLKLIRTVQRHGQLSAEAKSDITKTVEKFINAATTDGATQIVAVATSAIRDAANGTTFIQHLEHVSGLPMRVIDGIEEGRYSTSGALQSQTLVDGYVIDIGGGSLELIHIRSGKIIGQYNAKLGALRLSDAFLHSNPPTQNEIQALIDHVANTISKLDLPKLRPGEQILGVGGTIRTFGKVAQFSCEPKDQFSDGTQSISTDNMNEIFALLAKRTQKELARMFPVSADRTDSIIGGAASLLGVLQKMNASALNISEHGLREGIALELFRETPNLGSSCQQNLATSLAF